MMICMCTYEYSDVCVSCSLLRRQLAKRAKEREEREAQELLQQREERRRQQEQEVLSPPKG